MSVSETVAAEWRRNIAWRFYHRCQGLIVISIVFGMTSTVSLAQDAGDWPVFRGDAGASGVARTTLPEQLQVVWKKKIDGGAFDATPVIVDGVVYVGDVDGVFYALRLSDGDELWTFEAEIGFTAAAGVRDGLVFAGNIDGMFYCLDAETGKKLWEFDAGAEINGGPNFYGDNVLFGSQNATLYALDAQTGKPAWEYAINDQIRCQPTVVEGRAFLAGCDGKLHIIDLDVGEEIGSVEISSPTGSTPAVVGDYVFFGTESAKFLSINWRNEEIAWTYQSGRRREPFRSSAAATENVIIFGGRDKMVHGVATDTGEALWTFPTKGLVDGSPLLAGARAFVGSSDGRLYALDAMTGEKVWEYDAGGQFTSSAAAAGGRLVIGNYDGTLYCFGG